MLSGGDHNPRIVLMGCGGVGGIIAAHLLRAGYPKLHIVTHNPEIATRIRTQGIELREGGVHTRVPACPVVELNEIPASFDLVLLAMQPPQVEEAVRSACGRLTSHGAFVVLQNGLCEPRVAAIVGTEHVIGAIVTWGASMIAPGVYERTSRGGFTVGTLDGTMHPQLPALCRWLEVVGPVTHTPNLMGARWSKLAINCAISSLGTIAGQRLGTLLQYRFARRLGLEAITEAVLVAKASGVQLEKVAGTLDLNWVCLSPTERTRLGSPSLVAKHALLLLVGARFRRLRSSMLAAIERGREPPVDFLNGEVVRHGQAVGVPTPLNTLIVATVKAIGRGALKPSLALLRKLYEATMPLRAANPRAGATQELPF